MTNTGIDTKKRKEILKSWAEHKGFEYFLEDMEIILNKNRDSIAKIDLWSDTQRAKWVKIQANINSMNDIISFIGSYTKQSRLIWGIDPENLV